MTNRSQQHLSKSTVSSVIRKTALIVVITAVSVVTLIALGILLINTPPGKRYLTSVVNDQVREQVPGFHIAKIGGFVPFNVELYDIEISDAEGRSAVSVQRVIVDLKLLELLSKEILIQELIVEQPEVHAVVGPDGTTNLSKLVKKDAAPQAKEPSDWAVQVNTAQLQNGALTWSKFDEAGDTIQTEFAIRSLDVHASGRVSEDQLRIHMPQLEALATLEGVDASVEAKAHAVIEDRADIQFKLSAERLGENIPPIVLLAHARGPLERIDIGAELQSPGPGTATAAGWIRWPEDPMQLAGELAVTLNKLQPHALLSALPEATVNAKMRIAGSGIPLQEGSKWNLNLESSDSTFAGMHIETALLDAQTENTRWNVAQFDVQADEFSVTGEANGTLQEAHADLHATTHGAFEHGAARVQALSADVQIDAQEDLLKGEATIKAGPGTINELRFRGLNVHATATGTLNSPTIKTIARVSNASYNTISNIDATLTLQTDKNSTHVDAMSMLRGKRIASAQMHAPIGVLEWRDVMQSESWQTREFDVSLSVHRTPLARLARILPTLPSGTSGAVQMTAQYKGSIRDGEGHAKLRAMNVESSKLSLGDLATTLNFSLNPTTTRVRLRTWANGHSILSARARVYSSVAQLLARPDFMRTQFDVNATIPSFPIQAIAGVVPEAMHPVGGAIRGKAALSGTLTNPRGSAQMSWNDVQLEDVPAGALDMVANITPHTAEGEITLTQEAQGTLTGSFLVKTAGTMEADLVATDLAVAPLRPLAKALKNLTGTMDFAFTANAKVTDRLANVSATDLLSPSAAQTGQANSRASFANLFKRIQNGTTIADAKLQDGRFEVLLASPSKASTPNETPGEPAVAKIDETLRKLPRMLLHRFAIVDTSMRLVDLTEPNLPVLNLNDVAVTMENFGTRRELMQGTPAVLAVRARLEKRGELVTFATIDPLAERLTFAGQAEIENLQLRNLRDFLVAKSGLRAPEGEFNCYVVIRSLNGELSGGVKPMLNNAELEAADSGLFAQIKEALADLGYSLLSDDVPGRDAVATTIPIKGSLLNADIQVVPAILGIVRNAFVVGLASGFAYLPPETADERRGIFAQTVEALTRDDGPPKAQPVTRAEAE